MALNFPTIPNAKRYGYQMTPEQEVIFKLVQRKNITKVEEAILIEAIEFYKIAFAYLRTIKLSEITDEEAEEIKEYLKSVFNMQISIKNKINFYNVFRVSLVRDSFLENDKVKNIDFISYPPKDIIEKMGVYGRANSPKSTVFYCSFEPGVAILETKPQVGQRIIIAQWYNDDNKDFISYPITNNKTIDNESLKAATKAFQERMSYNHPLFAAILDLYFDFLSSEFVKDIEVKHPKKYEYLFSAYFSDWMLENTFKPVGNPLEAIKHYDCIVYPSIAIKHKSENLAIIPDSVAKLRPLQIEDCIVLQTMYDNPDLSDDKLPIIRQVLRTSTSFNGKKIVWDDD